MAKLETGVNEIHIYSLRSGPWNLRPKDPFFESHHIFPESLLLWRSHYPVGGSGRALMAWLTEEALRLFADKKEPSIPIARITLNDRFAPYYQATYGFERNPLIRYEYSLSRGRAENFLAKYAFNPFFKLDE